MNHPKRLMEQVLNATSIQEIESAAAEADTLYLQGIDKEYFSDDFWLEFTKMISKKYTQLQ